MAIRDKDGDALDGSKNYRLTVPANAPAAQYWSAVVYDRATHALIRNALRLSRSSQNPDLQKNADGSVDVYFGPKVPPGKQTNWIDQSGRKVRSPVSGLRPAKVPVRQDVAVAGHREGRDAIEIGAARRGTMKNSVITSLAVVTLAALAFSHPAGAQTTAPASTTMSAEQAREENAYAVGLQVYLWGFPLHYYNRSIPKSVEAGGMYINDFRKFTELKTAKDRFVVTPNNVTIDAYSAFDVTAEP